MSAIATRPSTAEYARVYQDAEAQLRREMAQLTRGSFAAAELSRSVPQRLRAACGGYLLADGRSLAQVARDAEVSPRHWINGPPLTAADLLTTKAMPYAHLCMAYGYVKDVSPTNTRQETAYTFIVTQLVQSWFSGSQQQREDSAKENVPNLLSDLLQGADMHGGGHGLPLVEALAIHPDDPFNFDVLLRAVLTPELLHALHQRVHYMIKLFRVDELHDPGYWRVVNPLAQDPALNASVHAADALRSRWVAPRAHAADALRKQWVQPRDHPGIAHACQRNLHALAAADLELVHYRSADQTAKHTAELIRSRALAALAAGGDGRAYLGHDPAGIIASFVGNYDPREQQRLRLASLASHAN